MEQNIVREENPEYKEENNNKDLNTNNKVVEGDFENNPPPDLEEKFVANPVKDNVDEKKKEKEKEKEKEKQKQNLHSHQDSSGPIPINTNPLSSSNLDFLNAFLDVYHGNTLKENLRPISAKRATEKKYEIQSYSEKFKVPTCTYITKDLLPTVYICNCSYQNLFIICESCKDSCHQNHTLYEIDNTKLNLTCNCGEEHHPEIKGELPTLENECLISTLYDYTSPRMFVKSKNNAMDNTSHSTKNAKDTICGYCYVSNLLPNTNFKDYDYFSFNDETYIRHYTSLEDTTRRCYCKLSVPIPIKAFLMYFNSICSLKEGKLFARLYFLENNVNLVGKSDKLFLIFNDCFRDINDYYEAIMKNEERFFVEDPDLLRLLTSLFSIMINEKSFSFIQVKDIFGFLTFQKKLKIIKSKLDMFSLKNFEDEEDAGDEKSSLAIIIDTVNEYFFSVYQFYIHIKNFFNKYNNNISIFTILNMTIFQRKYYIFDCLNFAKGYLTGRALEEYHQDLISVKLALYPSENKPENLPEMYIEWYEKILNARLFKFFLEDMEVHVHFLEIFCFLCRYDLLKEETRFRLYNILIDILMLNIENSLKSNDKKIRNFIVLRMDRIFEIVYYGLCYYNDKIILSKLGDSRFEAFANKQFVFGNEENDEEKVSLSRIFTLSLENTDLMVAQFHYIEDKRFKINLSKINFITKKILDFFLGNTQTQESESYLLSISNLSRFNYKIDLYYNNKIEEKPKNSLILDIVSKLSHINNEYFQYNIKINEYLKELEKLLDNEIFEIVSNNRRSKHSVLNNEKNNNNNNSNNINIDDQSEKRPSKDNEKKEVIEMGELNSKSQFNNDGNDKKEDNDELNDNDNNKNNIALLKKKSEKKEGEELRRVTTHYHNTTNKNTYSYSLQDIQTAFKSTNFIQQFKQLIYIVGNTLHFYQEPILSREHLQLLMDFLLISIYNDFENLIILSDCNYFQFFEIFKDIGLKDFLQTTSSFFYDKQYQFDNYFFIANVVIVYFYYIDPHDVFSFNHFYTENIKYDIIQQKCNFIKNLNHRTYDDLYNKNLIFKKTEGKKGSNIERTNNEEEFMLAKISLIQTYKHLEYSTIKDPKDEWVIQVARISRFFPLLIQIIESKDFASEENLRLFELMEYKLANMPVSPARIYAEVTSKKANENIKGLLEEFLINYYALINLLFKKQIYQLELVRDNLKIFPERDLKEFEKFNFSYLVEKLNLSEELSNQILIYVAFLKSNFFMSILSNKAAIDELIILESAENTQEGFRPENTLEPEGGVDKKTPKISMTKETYQPNNENNNYDDNADSNNDNNNNTKNESDNNDHDNIAEKNFHDIKVLYDVDKINEIINNFNNNINENEDDYENREENDSGKQLFMKIIQANMIQSYLNPKNRSLKRDIIKLKNFILNQAITLEKILDDIINNNSTYLGKFSIFENFELTILKPLVYITNILKETKPVLGGKNNYDYFQLMCYFLKLSYMIYSINLPKNPDLYDINDELPPKHVKFIGESLEVLIKFKKISFYQIENLIDLFENTIFLLYVDKEKNALAKIHLNTEEENEMERNVFFQDVYNEYKQLMADYSSNQLTIIKLFEFSDDMFNYGAEIISYLLKNQRFTMEEEENNEFFNKQVPQNFNATKKVKQKKRHRNVVDIKSSKLRLFNYLSYLTTLCTRSSKKYQMQFINQGIDGVKHAAYIVHTMVEKLFFVVYENTKKTHKNISENENNLFLVRLMKISLDYLLSSSENFNQSIQTMYITVTELYTKLSFNLIKIIYLIDENEIYDENIKEISETYTDILLNLFMNTHKLNLKRIMKPPEELEVIENTPDYEEDEQGNLIESKESDKKLEIADIPLDDYVLKNTDVLVNLFYKVKEILCFQYADKIIQLKLHKTYTNIIKLASTIITMHKPATPEFRKIFNPSKMLDFITISIKIIFLKYLKKYDFSKDNLKDYYSQINELNALKFNSFTYDELKDMYYENENIFNDDLFKLCCEIFIFLNWMNVNADTESRKLFKYLEEMSKSVDNVDSAKNSVVIKGKEFEGKRNPLAEIERDKNFFDEWRENLKIIERIQKAKIYITKEETIFALKFYNELLKSIDINVDIIKQENIVLEENKQDNNIYDKINTVAFKADDTDNNNQIGGHKKHASYDSNANKSTKAPDDNDEDDEEEEEKNDIKLKKVYFIENPLIKLVDDKKLQEFWETTERSSWIVKVSSVLNFYKQVYHEIVFNMNLKERNAWLYYTLNIDYSKVEKFSYFLILVINFMLLIALTLENYQETNGVFYATVGIGLALVILNGIFLIIFLTSRYRFLIDFDYKKAKAEKTLNLEKKIEIYFLKNLLLNSTSFFLISNTALGIVGIITPNTTFVFSILLLHFSKFSEPAKILVRAFKSSITQMFYMIVFLIILIWIYSLIAFYFVNDEYNIGIKNDVQENICASVSQCFISFFNYGVRNGGGIGDVMPKKNFTTGYAGRWLIDVLFFIIIVLLFLNMINGIIINTFSQLREDQEVLQEDINNNCFICNLDRNTLQKKKISFSNHMEKQHFIKDYLLFLINVKLKAEKDLDPDETRVVEALKINDVSFFPCEKTLDWEWTLVEKDGGDEGK